MNDQTGPAGEPSAASRALPRRCRAHGLVRAADGRCALCQRAGLGRRAWFGWTALALISALGGAGGVMALRYAADAAPLRTLERAAGWRARPAREPAPPGTCSATLDTELALRAIRIDPVVQTGGLVPAQKDAPALAEFALQIAIEPATR